MAGKAAATTEVAAVVDELRKLGTDPYKRILLNHGIREPVFGVKIEHLKKIEKRTKKNHQLALSLYDTGNYDAQYLAGLIADETKMTASDLRRWLKTANCPALCGSAVAWVTAESKHGFKLALEWIKSKDETIAQTGWTTLSGVVEVREDADLDLAELERLLRLVGKTIHQQPNLVRYAMNGFVIAVGSYVRPLTDLAVQTAESIGKVSVDMGNTACKVPPAAAYIRKVKDRGSLGKKRKTVRC